MLNGRQPRWRLTRRRPWRARSSRLRTGLVVVATARRHVDLVHVERKERAPQLSLVVKREAVAEEVVLRLHPLVVRRRRGGGSRLRLPGGAVVRSVQNVSRVSSR